MKRVGSALLLTLVLTACFGPRADPSTFFQLSPVPAPVVESPIAVSLGLGPVTLPAYLDRLQIVTRLSPNQLDVSETERWAEPLSESVLRTLQQNLAELLPGSSFVRFPWYPSEAPTYAVSVDVHRFEGDGVGTVVLDASWTLSRLGDRVDARAVHLEETGGGPTRADQVAVLSRLLAQLSTEIARGVRTATSR